MLRDTIIDGGSGVNILTEMSWESENQRCGLAGGSTWRSTYFPAGRYALQVLINSAPHFEERLFFHSFFCGTADTGIGTRTI